MSVEAPSSPGPLEAYRGGDYSHGLDDFRRHQAEFLQVTLEELHNMGDEAIAQRIAELYPDLNLVE